VANDLSIQRGNSGSGSPLSQRRSGGGVFSDLLGFDPFRSLFPAFANASAFGLDVTRADDGYIVEIPVAGFRPDQIDITVQDDTVVVSGKSDRRSFTRSLVVPDEIDPDRISANVDHGLLTLNLPRRPESQPRRIKVQTGAANASTSGVSDRDTVAASNGSETEKNGST
jgi:HSP20 family protein